jgi:hypothetical protein
MTDENGRSGGGRFAPGNNFSRGRPRNSITAALRRQADPEAIAARLLAVIDDPKAGTKDVLRAIEQVTERLEGKAVARSITMKASASAILPQGCFELAPQARLRVLDEVRERALRGELDALGGAEDGGEDDGDQGDHDEGHQGAELDAFEANDPAEGDGGELALESDGDNTEGDDHDHTETH